MDVESAIAILIFQAHIQPSEFGIDLTQPDEVMALLQMYLTFLKLKAVSNQPPPETGHKITYTDIDALLEVS